MRVIAFSCVHWMTRATQVDVYEYDEPLDYGPFLQLCEIILDTDPDAVVNLGDFTEDFWEDRATSPRLPDAYTLVQLSRKLVKLAGNHDRYGDQSATLDGVRYEHGHKLGPRGDDASVDGYLEALRENTKGARLVHGHSHVPYLGEGGLPLDVGSVTFSRTYGEIIDGAAVIRYLEGGQ